MFALIGLTVNQGDIIFLSTDMNATAKTTGKAHQMGVVKLLIATVQPAPPGAETAAVLAAPQAPLFPSVVAKV